MKLYSTAQVAKLLGLTVAAVKYHIHVAKDLSGERIGHSLVFTQDDLTSFLAIRRGPGRPKNTKEMSQ